MKALDDRVRVKRRNEVRIAYLRRRLAALSVTGFAVLFVLAAQHAVGSTKRRVAVAGPPRLGVTRQPASYFDEHDDSYSFSDGVPAASDSLGDSGSAPQASAPPPPVAQTSVS